MRLSKLESRSTTRPSALWGVVGFPGMIIGKIQDTDPARVGAAPSRPGTHWEVWVDLSSDSENSGVWKPEDVVEARHWLWSLDDNPNESDNIKRFEMGWNVANALSQQYFPSRHALLEAIHAAAEMQLPEAA